MAREWGWGEVGAGSGGIKGQHGGRMLEGWVWDAEGAVRVQGC